MNLFFVFTASFLAGVIVIPILIAISKKTNFLVDVPEGDALKIHKKNIPLLGGLAMAISIVCSALFFLEQDIYLKIVGFLLGFLIIFFLGFWDDLKWKHILTIKPFVKFYFLIVCTLISAIILWYVGIKLDFFPFAILAIIGNFLYVFLMINSVNYQDGMDGLAGGEVFISLVGFLIVSLFSYHDFALMFSLIAMGAVVAFLVFNLPPAKVFMGDSGAYSLGFILAVLAMLFSNPYDIYSILGPLLIIGLPIFDGVYTNIRRLMAKKSIFLGDRSHFYDKLLSRFNRGSSTESGQKGFSTKKTLAICYSLQIVFVVVGILIYK